MKDHGRAWRPADACNQITACGAHALQLGRPAAAAGAPCKIAAAPLWEAAARPFSHSLSQVSVLASPFAVR